VPTSTDPFMFFLNFVTLELVVGEKIVSLYECCRLFTAIEELKDTASTHLSI